MKFLLSLFLSFFILYAVDDNNFNEDSSFIDETHADFSIQVKSWGASLDDIVLGIYDFFEDENETQIFKTNSFLKEANTSNQRDANLIWFVPIIINTDKNNSELNASVVILKSLSKDNVSENSLDNNLSQSIELFPVSENKRVSLKDAKSSFFIYESMSLDENSSSVEVVHSSTLRKDDGKYEEIALPQMDEIKKYKNEENSIDEFFLTRKLLEERDKSYIRVSFLQPFNSLGPDPFRFNVKARVHLTRSRKRLKLFIENFNDDSAKNIGKTGDENSPSIGLEQESKEFFGIRPRYSIGFRGIDPFVRARYTFETDFGRWNFKPVQTFQYSIKDEFSEITELFLDTPTSDNSLLRFVVDRGTNSNDPGMHYDGFVQWFYHPRKHAGLSFNLGANGSTEYVNTIREEPLLTQKDNRVYNYLFLVRWRENIWKKWLFYEVGPGLNYHERYDYRPNYNIFFGFDMFFGHI